MSRMRNIGANGSMNYEKKIVCLACSRKPGGRCIAGREVLTGGYGGWIRPVSSRPGSEISLDERQYESGSEPVLLDIVRIPMVAPAPHLHQTENHLIDAQQYWESPGALHWNDLTEMVESPQGLWTNGDSTFHGLNDRIPQSGAASLTSSLVLIKPENVSLEVLVPGAAFGNQKRAVRAAFEYNGVRYNFKVTDIQAEKRFLSRQNGNYLINDELYFCISLAEAHTDGYCYKLVASVFSENPL